MRHATLPVLLAMCAISAIAAATTAAAQQAPQSKGDPREAIALDPKETETLLLGMRTYLETVQSIVAAMADNKTADVAGIAPRSGARLLQLAAPMTGLKLPLPFASMSFDTHDKFDRLAERAKRGASRTEILVDLGTIMGNCIGCHAQYRLAP